MSTALRTAVKRAYYGVLYGGPPKRMPAADEAERLALWHRALANRDLAVIEFVWDAFTGHPTRVIARRPDGSEIVIIASGDNLLCRPEPAAKVFHVNALTWAGIALERLFGESLMSKSFK